MPCNLEGARIELTTTVSRKVLRLESYQANKRARWTSVAFIRGWGGGELNGVPTPEQIKLYQISSRVGKPISFHARITSQKKYFTPLPRRKFSIRQLSQNIRKNQSSNFTKIKIVEKC